MNYYNSETLLEQQQEIEKLKEQNAALNATVEALKLAGAEALKYLIYPAKRSTGAQASYDKLSKAMESTPQQHLAERDAQKGWDWFIAGYHKMHIEFFGSLASSEGAEFAANQYADSIRQEKK